MAQKQREEYSGYFGPEEKMEQWLNTKPFSKPFLIRKDNKNLNLVVFKPPWSYPFGQTFKENEGLTVEQLLDHYKNEYNLKIKYFVDISGTSIYY